MTATVPAFRAVGRSTGRRTGLYCLPYAGAAMNAYDSWAPLLAGAADVWVAELPGRGTRFAEPPADDLPTLVAVLAAEIVAARPPRFVVFGHSMGATLAFELTRALEVAGCPPAALVVSGQAPPHLRSAEQLHRLDDAALTRAMHRLGGTPPGVLEVDELWALMLSVIRADLALVEGHRHAPGAMVSCPLVAYGSTEDGEADGPAVAGWAGYTTAAFASRVFPGGHFYFQAHPEALAIDLIRRMAAPVDAPAVS